MKIIGIGIVAFFLFGLQQFLYEKLWTKNLKASVSFAQSGISEGEEGAIVEIIENRKLLPLPMLKVRFQTSKYLDFGSKVGSKTTDQYYRNDIFQVGGGQKITRKLPFVGTKRGYYHIKNIDLVASDLFFTNEKVKSQSTDCYLYVYPKICPYEEFRTSLQKLNGEILVKRHLIEDPFEYRGIREYQAYDDIRSVNWKATARTGALKVNQKNYSAMQTIRIFLNLEDDGVWKKYREVEASMQIARGIASYFLAQGIKVSCYANGKDILTDEHMEICGGAGKGQLDAIGKAFARIDTEKGTKPFVELFQEKVLEDTEAFFTFFISPSGHEEFVELVKKCELQGMDYCWFYPAQPFDEPEVPGEIKPHVQFIQLDRM